MISLKKRNQGFTIVELLIVIVVIGILALLVITTYSGIQQKARNSKRQADLASVQTQLEAFYQNNGYYPSLTDMNTGTTATSNATASWVATNMKSLDQNALVDPSNPDQSKNLKNTPTAKFYSYEVADAANASCETDHTTCATYKLTAKFEGTVNGQAQVQKTNLD